MINKSSKSLEEYEDYMENANRVVAELEYIGWKDFMDDVDDFYPFVECDSLFGMGDST